MTTIKTYEIITVPDPVLRETAQPVSRMDEDIRRQMDRMLQTMYDAPGIGLAANQVGLLNRVLVMDLSKREENSTHAPIYMANPEVIWESEEISVLEEGCLSIPGPVTQVARAPSVRMRWTALDGQAQDQVLTGFAAICVQHEYDHLDGILTLDHLSVEARAKAEAEVLA